jgi:hypothetical protein
MIRKIDEEAYWDLQEDLITKKPKVHRSPELVLNFMHDMLDDASGIDADALSRMKQDVAEAKQKEEDRFRREHAEELGLRPKGP